MDLSTQLDQILSDLRTVATRVRPDQLAASTPCKDFKVADLLNHLIGGATTFAPQLRGDDPGAPAAAPTLDDAQRPAAAGAALDELLAACRAPGAAERTMHLPFGEAPGAFLMRYLTVDGMVHTWDLATATGQPYDPPADLAESVLATAHEVIQPEMRDGDTFAGEVAAPAGAPALTRLIAFTGRAV